MSSRSRTWSERRPPRAAAVLLIAVLGFGPAPTPGSGAPAGPSAPPGSSAPAGGPGAGTGIAPLGSAAPSGPVAARDDAALPLPVTAVLGGGGQTSLVVDLGASTGTGRRTVAVNLDGTPVPARLVPVVSGDLAVTLVVDASAAGAATLPAWLSAGARFILEAPPGIEAVVIADTLPAAAITRPQRGPTEIVRALTTVRAGGGRDTAAALTLAARQFPATPAGRKVVVLYTTAADAGGESATELGARFRQNGTILVVVGTAEAGPYWTDAAAATGGFFAPAGDPVVVPALDQVQTTLGGRYLVEFPTPPTLPARVSVRVGTGDLTLTGDVVVVAPTDDTGAGPEARTVVLWVVLAACLLALAAVALVLLRRRRAGEPVAIATQRPALPGKPALGQLSPGREPPRAVTAAGVAELPARPAAPPSRAVEGPSRAAELPSRAGWAPPRAVAAPAPTTGGRAPEGRSRAEAPAHDGEQPVARGRATVPRAGAPAEPGTPDTGAPGVARGRAAVSPDPEAG